MKLELNSIERIIDSETPGIALGMDNPYVQERHRERELMIALEGNADFTLNGKMHKASPGTAFFIDSWVAHKQSYAPYEKCCAHYWVHLHDRRLFGGVLRLNEQGGHEYSDITEFTTELTPLVRQRWLFLERNSIPAETRLSIQRSILALIFDDIALQPCLKEIAAGQNENMVETVRRCIIMNHGRIFPREELEHMCGCTEHHIMRIFKQQTGQTIGEFTNQVRMDFVASAMSKGITQKEIASQLGFSSASAFWLWRNRMDKKK